jgi:hypothetical protein
MGILRSGIFGGFRKKAGPLVGRRVRGQNIITGLHHPSTKTPTQKQLDAQMKFSLLTSFLSAISELVNIGFKHYAKNRSPLNVAYSYNSDNAFVLEDDQYLLNYPKIIYSRGHIEPPDSARVVLERSSSVRSIKFSWSPQGQSAYCQYTDLGSFLVYNPANMKAVTALNTIDRYALGYTVVLPPDFEDGTVHCYMNFASANEKIMGDSVYVGVIVISTLGEIS